MERFKRVLYKLLFPHPAVMLACVPAAAALLVYTFAFGDEEGPVAYLSYVFSAYAMTVVCAWLARHAGSIRETVGAAVHGNALAHRYLTDIPFRLHVSLYFSLGLNLLYAAMKLVFGAWYGSVWFGTLAVYYILLAVMRFLLLRHVNRTGIGLDLASEWRRCRLCGVILALMNIALAGVVVLVVQRNEGFEYAGNLIYVMAMYAFYNVITAAMDLVKYRKFNSPVMSAAKAVKLAAALVSMLSLETAMLTQFDDGENPEFFRQAMTGVTGGCVCLVVLAMAVYMIVSATKRLKETEESK